MNQLLVFKRCPLDFSGVLLVRIIVIMFFGFIPIDMVNGLLLRHNFPSISVPYKLFVLMLVLVFMLRNNKAFYVLSLTFIFGFYWSFHALMLEDIGAALKGLGWIMKFLATVFFYHFFSELIKINLTEKVFLIVKIAFCFLLVNTFLGALGLGYPMYSSIDGNGIGTRGFIYAGNELSAALILSGAILQMKLLVENKYINFFIVGFVMLTSSALITSKVSVLASFLIIIVFLGIKVINGSHSFKIPKKAFYYSLAILILLSLVGSTVLYYVLFKSNLIERLSYFYDKVDLITFLLSHRNVWAVEALGAYSTHYSVLELLFGAGQSWFHYVSANKLVEIDFVDFLLSYGLFGVFFCYGFIGYVLYKAMRFKLRNPYALYVVFMALLLVALSLTSGHIFSSGTAGFLIAALVAFSQYKEIE